MGGGMDLRGHHGNKYFAGGFRRLRAACPSRRGCAYAERSAIERARHGRPLGDAMVAAAKTKVKLFPAIFVQWPECQSFSP